MELKVGGKFLLIRAIYTIYYIDSSGVDAYPVHTHSSRDSHVSTFTKDFVLMYGVPVKDTDLVIRALYGDL